MDRHAKQSILRRSAAFCAAPPPWRRWKRKGTIASLPALVNGVLANVLVCLAVCLGGEASHH
jgi:hypothetical protein